MGLCCSCCGSSNEGDENETEMQETNISAAQAEANKKSMVISRTMSAPSIKVEDQTKVSGKGLAIVGVPIEQDAAYWEWHVTDVEGPSHPVDHVMFGVTGRKDRKFYQPKKNGSTTTEPSDENDADADPDAGAEPDADPTSPSEANGTQWMRTIEIQKDDVIGVAVQQSDLPMVQFMLNGEPLHENAINRFRGTVYPALYLASIPQPSVKIDLVMVESEFKQMSPGPKFGPVIVARSIV